MQSLYKFVDSPDVAKYFLAGRIKFTPINELNDPSELTSIILPEKVNESLRKLRYLGYSKEDLTHLQRQAAVLRKLAPRFQAIPVPQCVEDANRVIHSSFYNRFEHIERLLNATAKEISEKVGFFCLTKRFDSLPMWAHYAGNATGLVVEFEDIKSVFTGDETGVLWSPTSVRYEKETGGVTFDPRSHDALFFEKFSDWSYEQEVRIVAALESCNPLTLGNGCKMYVYDLPPSKIKRLILGWKMSEEKIDMVRQMAITMKSKTEIVQARFKKGKVSF